MNEKLQETFKALLPEFKEKTAAFYAGELDKGSYKGFSGLYGSYAQKGGKASMLRLRMTAGRVTGEKLAFVAAMIREYQVPRAHFTTCQTIQFHDLTGVQAGEIMEKAYDAGIVTMGGGGDFPRNVMCTPLSGTEADEAFDVMPYAQAAADYLMNFVLAEKMPRKLKVGFSSSEENVTHATCRDLGFVARKDGLFDVYSAGGLGNQPRFGVKVAEGVQPQDIFTCIKAMWLTFRAYGNYENRGKARTRYMVEALGGEEAYARAWNEKLAEVIAAGDTPLCLPERTACSKTGDGSAASGSRIRAQKQPGLYTVAWHPIGGQPDLKVLCELADLLNTIDGAELRLAPDETAYIINLTGSEAEKVCALTAGDTAASLFETSVSCIGAATCQVGLRDSQALLKACVQAVRMAQLPDGVLPQIHISGCPSSCGTHQVGEIGFRGATKRVDDAPASAFVLYAAGECRYGSERMGSELGTIAEKDIPAFLVELGQKVAAEECSYAEWAKAHPDGLAAVAQKYL